MKSLLIGTFATFFLSTLSGCVIVAGDHEWDDSSWQSQQRENRETISELELQTERSKIISKMGAPSFSDAFVKEGDEYRVLYYRTQHTRSDGETTRDETTPLVFKNDKLVGWGNDVLATIR